MTKEKLPPRFTDKQLQERHDRIEAWIATLSPEQQAETREAQRVAAEVMELSGFTKVGLRWVPKGAMPSIEITMERLQ